VHFVHAKQKLFSCIAIFTWKHRWCGKSCLASSRMEKSLTCGPEGNQWRGLCLHEPRAVGVGGRFRWRAKQRERRQRNCRAFTVTFATSGTMENRCSVRMALALRARVAQWLRQRHPEQSLQALAGAWFVLKRICLEHLSKMPRTLPKDTSTRKFVRNSSLALGSCIILAVRGCLRCVVFFDDVEFFYRQS